MKKFILTSIEKIRNSLGSGKAIVFVGSGVSLNSGMPSWSELVQKFANELDVDSNNLSSDDYIKIPQYYYNERGSKEYFDLLRQSVDCRLKPNPIHNVIVKLNPWHIITTNFDSLIESSVDESDTKYHLVKENKDIAYGDSNRMIIKMHGDIDTCNTVLKEDDYLSYSSNFRLIENTVKTLLSSYTTIFVGFSTDDPNFKILYQWVKNELGLHMNEAYLIDTSRTYSKLLFDYYKSRGIKTLYIKDLEKMDQDYCLFLSRIALEEEYKQIGADSGKRLYAVLQYILNKPAVSFSDHVAKLYNALEPYAKLNALLPSMIVEAIGGKAVHNYRAHGDLTILNNNEYYKFYVELFDDGKRWRNVFKENRVKLTTILKTLKKAGINTLCLSDGSHKFRFNNLKDDSLGFPSEMFDSIITFDNEKLELLLNKLLSGMPIEDRTAHVLSAAYCHYKLGNYIESYAELKRVSAESHKAKDYILMAIAEFNIKLLSFYIKVNHPKSDFPEIWSYADKIDLDGILSRLAPSQRHVGMALKKVFDFDYVNEYLVRSNSKYEAVLNQKSMIESGGASFNSALAEQHTNATTFYLFVVTNFIMMDAYTQYRGVLVDYVRTIFASHSITPAEKNPFISPDDHFKASEIDYFCIFIAANCMTFDDVSAMFSNNSMDRIVLSKDACDNMILAIENSSKHKFSFFNQPNTTHILMLLLARSNADHVLVQNALNIYLQYIVTAKRNYEYASIILASLNKNSPSILSGFDFEHFVQLLLNMCIAGHFDVLFDEFSRLLRNIFYISAEYGKIYEKSAITIDSFLCRVDALISSDDIHGYRLFQYICIDMCAVLPISERSHIESVISNIAIDKYDGVYESIRIDILLEALRSSVACSEDISKRVVEYLTKNINKIDQYDADYSEIISNASALHVAKLIVLPDSIVDKISTRTDFSGFVINPAGFNYAKFKIEWLRYIPESVLGKYLKNSNVITLVKNDLMRMMPARFKFFYRRLLDVYFQDGD
ncbi:hypothetical protein NNJEOMEG_02275 [Fundidesulfovibrio magnetotacticus]|uniref:SIR2-like domain-containing protein n=2 Tax=Fundidesulfovibrio magnetotacticus TaxID=2730080 RepID=A0A6V8LU09_9BACT|nr:hypothetical protein NNJEOMEG_02275 [Fundidesulfovibrio magnetotacticus]